MRYFTVILCLFVSACSDYSEDYSETENGCNIIIKHEIGTNGDRHRYTVERTDKKTQYNLWSSSIFTVGDCIKLTKAAQ